MKKSLHKIVERFNKFTFYKKKIFYVILTVIFSLILIVDVFVAALVPNASVGMGQRTGGHSRMEASSEMPDMSSDEIPDMSSSEMPDMSSMEEMELPGSAAGQKMGFLQTWKSHWVLIFIIFAILDAMSIFMMIRISKKEKMQEIPKLETKDSDDGEVHIARKPYKKKHSHYIWIIAVAGMFLMVIVIKALGAQNNQEVSQTEATVYTETAELGTINSVVPGTGTLADEEAEVLSLPSDITINKWYVSNGDTVEKGDKLASVDTVSVMSAIVEVQEKLESLDEALEEHENDEISDTITAGADGRVKVIYAKKNKSVVDVMYKSEALILISLDGKMAVSIETNQDVSAGDSVIVVLSDNTEIDGKVESKANGTAVITVSDEESDYGEKVTVKTEGGTKIGSGKLYIHSELKVTGFTGTVSTVNVSLDEKVSSGDTLLTLTDTDYSGEYELLLEKREALEAQIQDLFQIYQDKCVYAQCAGVISGLDEDVATKSSSFGEYVVEKLSEVTSGETESEEETLEDETPVEEPETPSEEEKQEDIVVSTYQNYIGVVTAAENGTVKVSCLPNAVTEIGTYQEISAMKNAMTEEKEIALSELAFIYKYENGKWTSNASVQQGDYLVMTYSPTTNSIVLALCVTEESSEVSSQETPDMNQDQSTGEKEMSDKGTGTFGDSASSGSEASNKTAAGGNTASAGASGMSEAETAVAQMQEEEIEADYSVSVDNWLSITPQDSMEITITVDELDILSLEKNQTAEVTLNAFPGQSFEGKVTAIDLSGTNSGGSTKYTAVIQIDREENMLAGMNASVKITIDSKEDVVSVPVTALVEQDGSTYVYTSYNEKEETFGDLVEVTTGVSDGENVEILSGLSEGSEYCYSCLDVVNYTSSFTSGGSFSMSSLFGKSSGGRGR